MEGVGQPEISGIVLAGGKSTRMGVDKRHLRVGGITLLDRALRVIDAFVDDLDVVVHDDLTVAGRGRALRDDIPERGPLGGLLTGLRRVRHQRALVVPVDMPLLSPPLLAYLIDASAGWDITVPRWRGGVEPLVGVYARGCAAHVEQFLRRPSASARDFVRMTDLKIRFVEEAELHPFGNPGELFFNVNTPDEALEAERLLRGRVAHDHHQHRAALE